MACNSIMFMKLSQLIQEMKWGVGVADTQIQQGNNTTCCFFLRKKGSAATV
jgi:hypothetical protein